MSAASESPKSATAAGRTKPPQFEPPADGPGEETEGGVVVARGRYEGGKRVGTWTWLHPSGENKSQGDYVDGLLQGLQTHWYDTGEVEAQGEFVDGQAHGRWQWRFKTGEPSRVCTYVRGKLDGPYESWHAPEQRSSRGTFKAGKRHGDWVWWYKNGNKRTVRGYADHEVKHGLEEEYAEDGTLQHRTHWEQGQRSGLCERFYPDGKPKERAHYVAGQYHGTVERWDAKGKQSTAEYLHGMPAELDAKALASIAKEIGKQAFDYEKLDAIGDLVDTAVRPALLVRMHDAGLLDLGKEQVLWSRLDAATLSGAQLASILSGIEDYERSDGYLHTMLTADWPSDLDALAMQVYARDREPLDAAWRDFPARVRKGFSLVLIRHGALSVDAYEGDILTELAKVAVEHGLPETLWVLGEQGTPHAVPLQLANTRPSEHFYAFIEPLGGRKKWAAALRKASAKASVDYDGFIDALELSTTKQLDKLVDRVRMQVHQLIECVIRLRNDKPAALIKLAESTASDELRAVAAIAAALRLGGASKPVPQELDALIGFDGYQVLDGSGPFIGLEETLGALEAVGEERAHAIIARRLEQTSRPYRAIPALGVFPDPGLRERAFEVIRGAAGQKHYDMPFMANALAHWGPDALPLLQQRYDAADEPALRDTYRWATLIVLAELAKAGQGWDACYDPHIEFHDWSSAVSRHDYDNFIQPLLVQATAALPLDRARTVLLAALDGEQAHAERPLVCLKDVKDTAVWTAAFTLLLDHAASLDREGAGVVVGVLESLGDDADDWVRWCLHNDPPPALMTILRAAYRDLETRMKA